MNKSIAVLIVALVSIIIGCTILTYDLDTKSNIKIIELQSEIKTLERKTLADKIRTASAEELAQLTKIEVKITSPKELTARLERQLKQLTGKTAQFISKKPFPKFRTKQLPLLIHHCGKAENQ